MWWKTKNKKTVPPKDEVAKEVDVLYGLTAEMLGTDHMVLRAAKVDALTLLNSEDLGERILALSRIILLDPTIDKIPSQKEAISAIEYLKEQLAEEIAWQEAEENLNQLVADRMAQKQEEYYQEIKSQLLKEQNGPENTQTLQHLSQLEKMENISLAASPMELLRPKTLEQIIGQNEAVEALMARVASPYPQHVILYGPPGVGKTSAARLTLFAAKEMPNTPFGPEAPFVEVDGNTLRWDPREGTNPLLGSVHDPIYQGARRDLAESSIPEPKLGLVSDAHGGILFIDEIGEMDPYLLNKLLKVLEDKRVNFQSSYYDPADPNVPKYIKQLFEKGAPADFILIGATTRPPEEINPAIRSRCSEIYFSPLTPEQIKTIAKGAAQRLGVQCEDGAIEAIARYTIEGRKANSLLADAFGLALQKREEPVTITEENINHVARIARISPYIAPANDADYQIGRTFGLGVYGFMGSVLEIEALAVPATKQGKGSVRFNQTAGSMAKDAVFNGAAVIRLLTGLDLNNYDIHLNVVGGGNIDGPSAGLACTVALYSAITKQPCRQDVAITGEMSIQGRVKPVGGIPEKIYGARQGKMKTVILPEENKSHVPGDLTDIEVKPVSNIEEALAIVLKPAEKQN